MNFVILLLFRFNLILVRICHFINLSTLKFFFTNHQYRKHKLFILNVQILKIIIPVDVSYEILNKKEYKRVNLFIYQSFF